LIPALKFFISLILSGHTPKSAFVPYQNLRHSSFIIILPRYITSPVDAYITLRKLPAVTYESRLAHRPSSQYFSDFPQSFHENGRMVSWNMPRHSSSSIHLFRLISFNIQWPLQTSLNEPNLNKNLKYRFWFLSVKYNSYLAWCSDQTYRLNIRVPWRGSEVSWLLNFSRGTLPHGDSYILHCIVTGLDDQSSEFSSPRHPVQTSSGAHPPSLPWDKAARAWNWPLTSIWCRG
jgi:hypothetical protein